MHNKIPYYMAYPEFFMYGTEGRTGWIMII